MGKLKNCQICGKEIVGVWTLADKVFDDTHEDCFAQFHEEWEGESFADYRRRILKERGYIVDDISDISHLF
ncbi:MULTISPECIES: hypothetical protein [Bacillus]|uniref:hypothetical protein n=1 Tax=Bacillus TaxID=1386 RepID=UPI000BA8C973|nr:MULTISPECIES: hypothetical protein [Bacillus]MBU2661771.1 hypothetical protein [Bacillus cabrialesii]MED4518122.1 hypothetical protein [Bacillus subtilis]PAO69947.1 hypothetical protein CIK44_04305 [Bacillus sp. X2(2017)]